MISWLIDGSVSLRLARYVVWLANNLGTIFPLLPLNSRLDSSLLRRNVPPAISRNVIHWSFHAVPAFCLDKMAKRGSRIATVAALSFQVMYQISQARWTWSSTCKRRTQNAIPGRRLGHASAATIEIAPLHPTSLCTRHPRDLSLDIKLRWEKVTSFSIASSWHLRKTSTFVP